MFTRKLFVPILLAGIAGLIIAQKPADSADDEPETKEAKKSTLETFMRKKLDASSKILEGLCQEDATLVETGANELSEMSKVEVWNVLTDAEYREHSREYRDNAARVAAAAKEGDFDKAALRWFDVTMSCLECHEHVRGEREAPAASDDDGKPADQ